MTENLSCVIIYTDGGCRPNPGPGGWGAVLLHSGLDRGDHLHPIIGRLALTPGELDRIAAGMKQNRPPTTGSRVGAAATVGVDGHT